MHNMSKEYSVSIRLGSGEGALELCLKEVILDSIDFSFHGDLDTVLIQAVDKLLERNKLDKLSLSQGVVTGNIDETSSSYRVAQAFLEAIKLTNYGHF